MFLEKTTKIGNLDIFGRISLHKFRFLTKLLERLIVRKCTFRVTYHLTRVDFANISEDQNLLPQIVIENRCELREILSHYDSIFSEDKYNAGELRVEPQRIILISDLPVHLRSYRTTPIQEKEIKGQVEKLLQAGLIKESNSPYSAPATLSFKRNEAHHPQTNDKNERVNQYLVTRFKCKINASSTKIPWTKQQDQVCNEYNLTPHSINKYPPAYLLFGLLPYQSPIYQNVYYENVDEARELALQKTIDYHIKNKIRYDARCIEKKSTQTARGGRVRSTTPAEDRYIILSAKRNRRTTAQQVANQFLAASGKQISGKTVARRLRGGGLYARRPVVCVPLTRQHRNAHLQGCREHYNWTEQDWACVLFSDEKNIQEKDRYPTCSIMVWAGIMINGHTRLHVVANGTMTGQRYIDEVLLPHVRLFRGAVDLNPIENVRNALGRQVAVRNYPPTNKNTLIRALTEEWDKLP
ncbi:integrase catalytic domain-containing protein [Trichonephila clavipes]|nr:integrase catalytic domain-containing protein [Trichonephila clavipes]